ncbi:sensor domain-containing phosphodiesterase [Salinisphaera sp. T31B1]|uniref:putative bifunctional diguanylate cyclase/phosphodiesterase n=1 Tax=Salinisphaera sp. T31B1 TaxID=727963 RepID=UPI003341DFED
MAEVLNEAERLQELRSLDLLDTPSEERFDRYTRLIASVLEAPMALVTLVDRHRQWFKSAHGIDRCETSREDSFCTHALADGFLEVADTRRDARFRNTRLVTGPPHIRSYVGAVLRGRTGQPLGTLCVLDVLPRRYSAVQRSHLRAFAHLVEEEINRHVQFESWSRALQRRALRDETTGLPGVALFEELLTSLVTQAISQTRPIGLVHFHLANFEVLHALVGQSGSVRVLRIVARRLRQNVRADDRIGMLGPDRLGLAMTGTGHPSESIERVTRLCRILSAPIRIDGVRLPIDIRAGISRAPDDSTDPRSLIGHARTAAAAAAEVSSAVRAYSRDAHRTTTRNHERLYRLAEALSVDGLDQVYQPILDGMSGRIVGVEALARWTDGRHGPVSPAEFIPLVEAEPELRRLLTRRTLDRACAQLADWNSHILTRSLYVAVNVPGAELYCDDFTELVLTIIRAHGIAPSRVVLEITEKSVITDIDTAARSMRALREHGLRFAVDDFGTGYSSLRYLQQLPLDILKIDRSFTQLITHDKTSHDLTASMLQIARTLGLAVIVEGVETTEQYELLQRMGADNLQGYLFGLPETAAALSRQLAGLAGVASFAG